MKKSLTTLLIISILTATVCGCFFLQNESDDVTTLATEAGKETLAISQGGTFQNKTIIEIKSHTEKAYCHNPYYIKPSTCLFNYLHRVECEPVSKYSVWSKGAYL